MTPPVTISPQKAPGFHRPLADDKLTMVPLWLWPRLVSARRAPVGRARWHGPTKGLASWAWPREPL
jgi:hypothetical protein